MYVNWGRERNDTDNEGGPGAKGRKYVDKDAAGTLATPSQHAVVRVRAVMGRLIGLAGDTEVVQW